MPLFGPAPKPINTRVLHSVANRDPTRILLVIAASSFGNGVNHMPAHGKLANLHEATVLPLKRYIIHYITKAQAMMTSLSVTATLAALSVAP